MKTTSLVAISAIAASLLITTTVQAGIIRPQGKGGQDYVPTGKGWGVPDLGSNPGQKGGKGGGGGGGGGPKATSNGINYHGGPVMTGGTTLHYIWYGDWSYDPNAATILNNLASSLGGSPYFNINTTYYDGGNTKVSNLVNGGSTRNYTVPGSSTALSDADVQNIVKQAIQGAGESAPNSNDVYVVLTPKNVNETSGFCTQYCGWHTHANILGVDTKFAFVGDAARCPSACSAQATGPNGSSGADAMASVIAHETDEMVTDPDLNAWYDHRGYENADKCAWKFGTTYTANGAYANMNLGGMDYLIQQNWENANGGSCVLSYP